GIVGALCGRHDSEFALFAGGTLTALLIRMTPGGGATAATPPARAPAPRRAAPAGGFFAAPPPALRTQLPPPGALRPLFFSGRRLTAPITRAIVRIVGPEVADRSRVCPRTEAAPRAGRPPPRPSSTDPAGASRSPSGPGRVGPFGGRRIVPRWCP